MEKEISKILEQAKKDKQILAVAQFGSSLKGEGKDIDLCLFLNKKLSNLEMSNKRIEFLKNVPSKFDIQIFQQLPVYIRIRIIRESKVLYCKNEEKLYDLAYQTLKEFNFYEKIYNLYLEKVKNG